MTQLEALQPGSVLGKSSGGVPRLPIAVGGSTGRMAYPFLAGRPSEPRLSMPADYPVHSVNLPGKSTASPRSYPAPQKRDTCVGDGRLLKSNHLFWRTSSRGWGPEEHAILPADSKAGRR
jgi:hypothetical protein